MKCYRLHSIHYEFDHFAFYADQVHFCAEMHSVRHCSICVDNRIRFDFVVWIMVVAIFFCPHKTNIFNKLLDMTEPMINIPGCY